MSNNKQIFFVKNGFLMAMLFVMLGITLFAWKETAAHKNDKASLQFKNLIKESEKALIHRMDSYEDALLGGVGFFAGSSNVSRVEWKAYVDAIDVQDRYPGISGIGYIEKVRKNDVESYLKRVREDNYPDFEIKPKGDKNELFVIQYIDPIEKNKAAVGLDISFEKNRRDGAQLAIDTGRTAITKRILLVQDKTKQPGFLLLLPMYKKNAPTSTLQERQDNFQGWIYAPFIGENFIKDLTAGQNSLFDIHVYDGDTPNEDKLIYASNQKDGHEDHTLLSASKTIQIKQQNWTIVWHSTKEFEQSVENNEPILVLIGGIALSILIFGILFITSRMYQKARDIAEKMNAELSNSLDNLEWQKDALEAAKLDAESSREEAERANNLKSEFLATMSHEIRTPMNGILGMTELLLETDMTSKQQTHAKTVMHSAEALLEIINDILDFSKIEAGKLELEPIAFNLHTVCEDVSELLAIKTKEKAVELILRYRPDVMEDVIGDPGRVRQIILNLLSNAVKFTEKGHVLLDIKQIEDAGIKDDEVKFKISVEDTGVGVPEDAQGKLFDKFSQADSSTTRKFGGTGLGLAICKQLAEMMGGEVGLESNSGEGSVFWFTLILKKGDNVEVHEHDISNLSGLRALVVDDIEVNQQLICEQLTSLDIDCSTCDGANEALLELSKAHNNKEPYDLVLIDYLMPEMNGEELAKKIRANKKYDASQLVMLSSAGGATHTDKFKKAGFSGYSSKPIRSHQLFDVLSIVWNKYRSGEKGFFVTIEDTLHRDQQKYENAQFKEVHVLVAEDNRVNQEFATEILEGLGCSVHIAANGIEAIDVMKNANIDIIFMDVNMPNMNGYEASRIITSLIEDGKVKNTPIVALTAADIDEEREECLASGMVDFVAKPMRKNALHTALVKHLAKEKIVLINQTESKILEGKNILIAEDNRVNMEFACEMLNSFGCNVTRALDGEQALKHFKTEKFDIILMDIQMPLMDGYEATKEIRKLEKAKKAGRTHIIALTANAMKGDDKKCKKAGMDDYLSKPVRMKDLQSMMEKWVNKDAK